MDQKSLEQLMSKLLDKKLDPVLKTLDNLQSKMDKIDKLEESINFLSKEYDDFIPKIKSLEEENYSRLADENVCLKAEIQSTANSLKIMKQELNNAEQYSRRDCIEIKGIPFQRNEVCNEVVKTVGHLIGVDIKDQDISVSHRLAAKSNSHAGALRNDPAIIVKFVRREVRDKFYGSIFEESRLRILD
jgi:chromosome segregation ATPase